MKIQVLENFVLKKLNTFNIGGNAKYYVPVKSKDELIEAFSFAKKQNLSCFILGNGSNVLFDDLGFNGLVIHNKIDFCNFEKEQITVGSGFSFARLGVLSAQKNLAGLEFAASIPGTVGGAIFMNASAFGGSVSSNIDKVVYLTMDGEEKTFLKNELNFDYRSSSFQELSGCIISATFNLKFSKEARSKQLEIIEKRKKSQPTGFSAGCVFRNGKDYFAGELIEKCDFKGKKVGLAFVSSVHANFIMNEGNAKSEDVLNLIAMIKKEVKSKYGVDLKEEIKYLPWNSNGFSR